MKQPSKAILLVTTGDPDGVGFEVTAKALVLLPRVFFQKTVVCLFVTKDFQKPYLALLKKKFSVTCLYKPSFGFSPSDLIRLSSGKKPNLFFVVASDSPADWIFYLSKLCLKCPQTTALVTGPLSKTLIKSAGYSAIGHTEILADVSKSSPLYMGFVGKFFNVVLLTGHIPLKDVSATLKNINWKKTFEIIRPFVADLKLSHKPIGVLALNPHAGEKGLISAGEDGFLKQQIEVLNSYSTGLKLEGPLVPDAAFLKANWQRYSVYLSAYHDQGLIPFKAIHGQDSGVHITLGLPFIRTSVDHGTAKEIYGKNQANPNSMKEALTLAQKLLVNKIENS